MKSRKTILLSVVLLAAFVGAVMSQSKPIPEQREQAVKAMQSGNFRDAFDVFRKLCLDPDNDSPQVVDDLNNGVQCLIQLGRVKEFDEFIESTVKVHEKNWRLLQAAAQQYVRNEWNLNHGFIIAGQFERGPHRGGGKLVNAIERDRVRALQLMVQAMPLAQQDDQKRDVSQFYINLSNALLNNRGYQEAWRLQYLTDLDELPDHDEGRPYFRQSPGAAVDRDGNPIFHYLPQDWESAETDGQRWRWALEEAIENSPSMRNAVRWQQGNFYEMLYGVASMQREQYGLRFGRPVRDDDKEHESGTYALHTLGEDETIARLATGIKRFTLPDEFNHIRLYQQIAAEPRTGHGEDALNRLAQVFENRRQYPRAAEYWRESIEQYGPGSRNWKPKRLDQIVGNWGQFESTSSQPAGVGATVEFRYRNAKTVRFVAHPIDIDLLLNDVKAYLRSDPGRLDWKEINIANLGHRLVTENQTKYIQEKTAEWSQDLEPRELHFDRRITVTTPLQQPGAYLLTAQLDNGNTSKIVLWVADTAIVHKPLSDKHLYYVADAGSGAPISGANIEFFGYRQKHLGGNRFSVLTTNFAERTDNDGQVIPDPRDLKNDHQWLVIARTGAGRFAYMGFQRVWTGRRHDAQYNEVKIFGITDRPVYRPKHKVNYKFWIGQAQYDMPDESRFAGRTFPVDIVNPRGEKVSDATLETDEFGGAEGSFDLPADATLGMYNVQARIDHENRQWAGNVTFRVEEYKKPEFEVTVDAPSDPVMLGEKITAKIKAKYYFGSPVTKATVKYKVVRTDHTQDWYPIAPWDWCYGRGYWWFAYDYTWYPGWDKWVGCVRPVPPWFWRGPAHPPELVAEQELEIGEDGTVDVEIDTEIAKAMHADKDHKYTITAEVRDESRRTIVGEGNVLVARRPFRVFSWVDRGHYRVGDTVRARFLAQTLDNKPVEGKGELTLLRITYDPDRQPIETPVETWELDTNDEGRAEIQIQAATSGQYRLSMKVTDAQGHTIEGGYIFTVVGRGFDGSGFRFDPIELIPDKAEYQPGDTVRLQVNTDQVGGTVLLFIRPANGMYLPPKVLRLEGKSTVGTVTVVQKDMPNFFVEAMTISGGNVHTTVREIVVPPEKRILNVDVMPSQEEYKPGEKAKVKLRLTDFSGENFVGSTVLTVYDKALEYISGGSNVADIKEFFWKWRRQHNPTHQTSLDVHSAHVTPPGQDPMQHVGVFGATVADDLDSLQTDKLAEATGQRRGAEQLGMRRAAPGGPEMMMQRGAARFEANGLALAAPMAAAADAGAMGGIGGAVGEDRAAAESGPVPELVEPTVRTSFADTALWVGALTTDSNGEAEVELDMPENLTAWTIKVWGMGRGTRVGSGDVEVVTRKNLILRLQAPRFFVQKDEVVLSANVHNYLASEKEVTVSLELPGELLQPLDETTVTITVPADGEQRVDWRVKVLDEGTATVRMKALTDEESDATEVELPCFVHGMLKMEAWAGTVRPDDQSAKVTINVPAERRVEQTMLEIRYSPTLAGAMVDALPYLADYPYGCTEQTLNRFLPSVITQNVLMEMNLDLAAIGEKRTNLNAQEIGDDRERAKQWQRFDRNPVFDPAELNRMVTEGVKLLTAMQNADGGWGWFSGHAERSWPHTTALIVHGLQIARENDIALVPGVLENGEQWLKRYQDSQIQLLKNAATETRPWKTHADNLDAFVYMVLVDAGIENQTMRDFLYRDRVQLAVYAKAMFGLALHKIDDQQKLEMILSNIEQFLVQDDENDTAWLRLPADNYWWYWYGSEAEANAYYLKLLARTDANGQAAPRLVKYLLNNRKHATYWSSTRDTAIVVEAFAEYLRASGELKPEMVVEVWMDGEKRQEVEINRDNLFTFDNKFVLAGADVADGSHEIEIRRRGQGPVYFNAYLTNFTLEDPITKAGLEIKVQRQYYRLVPEEKTIKVEGDRGQPVGQRVEKYRREPLENLDTLKSGDLVEIELEIDSKNDYEYIMFEDMKAAGFEPVEVRSGYSRNGLGAYMELRDERVAFFVRWLARGKHSIAYRMRAEIPGQFSALPTKASAMYAPELRANSDEFKLKIED